MTLRSIAAVLCLSMQTALAADIHLLVVSGIGGDEEYSRLFKTWSLDIIDAAEHELGISPARMTYLSERSQTDSARVAGSSRKEDVVRAIGEIASRAAADDVVLLILIGHGSMRDGTPMFNVPGPDISATELAEALGALAEHRTVVINTAPSSGPFLPVLAAPNRVVITATQNGAENNHTVFANHLAAALASDGADSDKDQRVSVLEAFEFARREVEREYRSDRRLLTEHAMLDDNGDGRGTMAPSAEAADGALARVTYLKARTRPLPENESERRELIRLRARSDELERQLEALRGEKQRLDATVYEERLEALLVELALNRRALQAAESGQ